MQTVTLKPETASKVQELARINIDSAEGFNKAAEMVDEPSLKQLFKDYAKDRKLFANELTAALGTQADDKVQEGTLKAQMHRWWMELRGKLGSAGSHAILSEAERGEDKLLEAYEEVILETTGSPVSDVLHAQLRKIKPVHDRIRTMRDAAEAKKS